MNDGRHRTYTDFARVGGLFVHLAPSYGVTSIKVHDPEDEVAPGVWLEYNPAGKAIGIRIEKAYAVETWEQDA